MSEGILQTVDTLHRALLSARAMLVSDHLTLTEARILSAVRRQGNAASQVSISNATGIDTSTVAYVVTRLVKAGLVTKSRNSERGKHSFRIGLTTRGEDRFAGFTARARETAPAIESLLQEVRHQLGERHGDETEVRSP